MEETHLSYQKQKKKRNVKVPNLMFARVYLSFAIFVFVLLSLAMFERVMDHNLQKKNKGFSKQRATLNLHCIRRFLNLEHTLGVIQDSYLRFEAYLPNLFGLS